MGQCAFPPAGVCQLLSCTCGHLPFHLGPAGPEGPQLLGHLLALNLQQASPVFSHGSGFQERQRKASLSALSAVACFTLDNVHWPKQVLWPAPRQCARHRPRKVREEGHLWPFLATYHCRLTLSLDPAWEPCPAHTHFTAPCMCHPHFTECAPGPREVKGVVTGPTATWPEAVLVPAHYPIPPPRGPGPWQCGVRETKTCHGGAKPGSPNKDILKQRHGRPRCLPPGTGLREHPLQPLLPAAWPRPALRSPCCPPPGPAQEQGGCFQFRVVSKSSAILQLLNMRSEIVIVKKTVASIRRQVAVSFSSLPRPQFCSVRPAWLACAVPPGPACLEDLDVPYCTHTLLLSASHACFCLACKA